MFNKKEILIIVPTIIILAFIVALTDLKSLFLISLAYVSIIIILNIFTKKAVGYFLDTDVEIRAWEMKRYWFRKHDYFKRAIPIGLFLPIILKVISVGFINWTAALSYEVKAKIYRAAKRHGLYAFSDISEAQIGVIAAVALGVNLIAALIGYFAGFPDFSKLSLAFVFFSLIPFSDLDGNRIFFGSVALWIFMLLITLIFIIGALIIF
jgi:hypothetical protein